MTNEEVLHDFRRRYDGTYVWLAMEQKGIETLVKVTKVLEHPNKIGVLQLASEEFGTLSIYIGSEGHSLKFKSPPVGVFQYGREAYLFRRKPARQYARGICTGNSILWNVTRNFVGSAVEWSPKEIQAAFDHKTYSVDDAMKMLGTHEARCVALPDNFSVCHSLSPTPDKWVFHWQHPIARCNEQGKLTHIYESVYKPKLEELFK